MTVITFLKDNEIEQFDFPPRFNDEERRRFLVLPDSEIKFRKPETKIGYISARRRETQETGTGNKNQKYHFWV